MEELERIAGRVGRVACSPDNSPETLLESASLVSELAVAFEAVQQRQLQPGDLPAEPAASEAVDPHPLPSEELERQMRELLEAEYA